MNAATILCVEDEPHLLSNLAEFLSAEYFQVMKAANGREGLKLYSECKPDVVLCDIRMPDMSGLQMLDRINQDFPERAHATPFIFLTAWGDKSYAMSAKSLGCDDFLVKPVDFDLLLVTLQSRLHKWQNIRHMHALSQQRLQSSMLSILNNHLQRPVHALTSYCERMEKAELIEVRNCIRHLESLSVQHLNDIHATTDVLALAMKKFDVKQQPCDIRELMMQAAALEWGMSSAQADAHLGRIWSMEPCHLWLDPLLCQRAFRRHIHDMSVGTSKRALMFLHLADGMCCMTFSKAQHASSKADEARWLQLKNDDDLQQAGFIEREEGLSLLYALAVCQQHGAELWLLLEASGDIHSVQWRFTRPYLQE